MIKRLRIENLNGFTSFNNSFHEDVNVLTGINGAGKTSVLRLAWYLMSANVERVFDDCTFDHLEISTTSFDLSITHKKPGKTQPRRPSKVAVNYKDNNNQRFVQDLPYAGFREAVEEVNQLSIRTKKATPTVIFPTFRRIEGGFSYLGQRSPKSQIIAEREYQQPIEYGLQALSRRLGVFGHRFVASISTADIKNLLTQAYADVSRKTNEQHAQMAHQIARIVADYQSHKKRGAEGTYISQIADLVASNDESQKQKLSQFDTVSEIVSTLFNEKSINISPALKFGSSENILDSDVLSAGEKQFLGFLAYNALLNQGTIFIDEPELSLHLDWQRQLVPTLRKQNPTNQLILATHSPFIYSMLEDRELYFEDLR